MSLIKHYRALYEYEADCNGKMLAMMESVPANGRTDPRFQRAVTLANHLAACRENWLTCMAGESRLLAAEQAEPSDLAALHPRFAALDQRWTDYLAGLDDDRLARDFEFAESNGESFHLPIGVQVEQLAGHASYHRGQITLLVTALGGEVVDTDYTDWWWTKYRG